MNPSGTQRVMLLIDADNVSDDVIEQAVAKVKAIHGEIHVRRAYCTAESAVKRLDVFKAHSIRPMVNISAGKNSTDIALAVDAMDLVIAERPAVVVLVSSDSDFAPLVVRLREKGCQVEGIGQEGKTGDDTLSVYEGRFEDLAHRRAKATRAPAPRRAPRAAKAPPPPAPKPALPPDVEQLLEAVPELRSGEKVELRRAAEGLRRASLLSKNGPSTRLFRKHAEWFELSPLKQPNKVQFRPGGGG